MNISDGSKITLMELLKKSWVILKENLFSIIAVCLIVGIPYNVLNYFFAEFGKSRSDKIIVDILRILLSLASGISSLAIVFLTENSYNGRPRMSLRQSFCLAYKRWGSLITTSLLMDVILFVLMLLLVIPSLIWMVYYVFFIQVIALTDLKWKKALNYSKFIVRGRFWRVTGYMFVVYLFPEIIIFFISIYRRGLVAAYPDLSYHMIPINVLSYILFGVSTVAVTVLYLSISSAKNSQGDDRTTYEKINAFVNKNSLAEAEDTEDIVK